MKGPKLPECARQGKQTDEQSWHFATHQGMLAALRASSL